MNKLLFFLFPLFLIFSGLPAAPNYPFPTRATYSAGVIKPNNVTQAQMEVKIQTLYDEWKQEFLRINPDTPNQAYVFYNESGNAEPVNAVSISEGHGYGMLLAVYMAGYDPQAQTVFDNLFRFYQAFPSKITPSLMAWQQVEEEGRIVSNFKNGEVSATDGDLDIAFALLLADKQWGSAGPINYFQQAKVMIDKILTADVNLQQLTLKLGDWVSDNDPKFGRAMRTSDFMLNHLKNFALVSGDSRWQSVIAKTYAVINELFTNFSSDTGLLPDFVEFKNGGYGPASTSFLEHENDGYYSWNACRTPWRIATDHILTGDKRALTQLTTLNNWIRTTTNQNPHTIKAGYKLDGTPLVQYGDLAFVTPFAVSAMISANNQSWLNDLWSYTSTQPTSGESYFANTIRLLCFLVISGNWWTPQN